MQKLIRDKLAATPCPVPSVKQVDYHTYRRLLREKLLEEAAEVATAPYTVSIIEELGDLLEVMQALAEAELIDWNDVRKSQSVKREVRGGFSGRFTLNI